MANNVQLGVSVVDNTKQGLSSAFNNTTKMTAKMAKQLVLEVNVAFPNIASKTKDLQSQLSKAFRAMGNIDFVGNRLGKKGNVLGLLGFEGKELRKDMSLDAVKEHLARLKNIQSKLKDNSLVSGNTGDAFKKEQKYIANAVRSLETYKNTLELVIRTNKKFQTKLTSDASYEQVNSKRRYNSQRHWIDEKVVNQEMDAEKKRREAERKAAIKSNKEIVKENERMFKSRVKSKQNAIDIQTAIDNERAARDKANQTHSDRTVENIKKEIAALKELRKAENDLDKAQGKKSRNARHDSYTNQRIKLLEQEAEAVKKAADQEKEAQAKKLKALKAEKDIRKQMMGYIIRAFSVHQIVQFGKKVADVTGYFQQQQVALEGILQSATKARKVLNDITNFAVKSPFRTDELVRFTKQLSAFGIGSDELFPTVTKLADISAGLGVDMDRIILAYGQVRSASVLRGQELRQFTEAGIPMVDALAKKLTKLNGELVTTADVFELISKRQVSFEMVSSVLSDMTSEGGRFYKMQEELTNTLAGQISKLKDLWTLSLNDLGKSASPILNGIVKFLQLIAKNAKTVSIAIAAAFPVALLTSFLRQLFILRGDLEATRAQVNKIKASFAALKGTLMSIGIGLVAGAITGFVFKAIEEANKLKNIFKEIEQSFSKENAKLLTGLDELTKKITSAKINTKEFNDAVSTLAGNYGEFVNDDVIKALQSQGDEASKTAKEFSKIATSVREAIIAYQEYKELKEKQGSVRDEFVNAKTSKSFVPSTNEIDIDDDIAILARLTQKLGRQANLSDRDKFLDELFDKAVTEFADSDNITEGNFRTIFAKILQDAFPAVKDFSKVVDLGWARVQDRDGWFAPDYLQELKDANNLIKNNDYDIISKAFENVDLSKVVGNALEQYNRRDEAYRRMLLKSPSKEGERTIQTVLSDLVSGESKNAEEAKKAFEDLNSILADASKSPREVAEAFKVLSGTMSDSNKGRKIEEIAMLYKKSTDILTQDEDVLAKRLNAITDFENIVKNVDGEDLSLQEYFEKWNPALRGDETIKQTQEKIAAEYKNLKEAKDFYAFKDSDIFEDNIEFIEEKMKVLEKIAGKYYYDVDLTDKKDRRNKYERIRTTDFFDEWLSLITKAEDDMKKIVGVTGYTDELGNFVNELSKENYLKAFFEEGGNPFEDIFAKMTKAGVTEFLPEFNQETLKNIFREAGWEEGKEISIPDFKAMYETVVNTIGNQVIAGLKAKRDQYAKGTSERNSLEAEIDRWQEAQAKYVKTMTTRWGGDEIEKKINLAIKELTNIGSKLDDIKSQRSMYERISKSSNPLIAKKALPDVSGYFSDSRYTSDALREMLRSEGGAGIASTLVGERLKSLLNGGSLNIDNLSALFEIIRDLEEQAGEKEITLADGKKIANSDQFKETTSKVVDIISKLVESILKEYDKLAQYKTGDLKISDEILQAAEDFKNALKEIEETEKDPKRAASMKLSATQQYYDKVLKSLGGSEIPYWIKTMFGKEGAFGGISDSGRFTKGLSGGSSLLDMIIQGKASDINKLYESGKFGDVGSDEAMQGAADKLASAASSAAGSIAMVDAIINAVYQAINAIVELGKGVLEVDAKVNNKLKLREGANGKLYDKDGNINIGNNYYKKQERREIASQALDIIGNFNNHIMGGWEKLKSGDIFGAITETAMSIADLIGDIIGVGDTKLRQQQDELIRSNERLANAMNSLEHALSLSVGNEKYDIYKEKATKLREQQLLYEQLLALENQKKNGDDEKAQDYASQAKEAGDQLDTLLNDFKTEVLGTADELANTLTDALVGAFREGTNAARAWRDAVRSYIGDILKQELMTKIIAPRIDEIMDSFFGSKVLSSDEVKDLFSNEDKVLDFVDALNQEGTNLIDIFENLPQSLKDLIAFNGDTSALSGGISGITEDTARTLEGLANSMLMQMILTNRELSTISQSGFAQVQVSWFNDMLQQARATRTASEQIKQILDETRSGIRPLKVEVM